MDVVLKPNERIDELIRNNLKIIQSSGSFRFSMDAVLLSGFVTVRSGDNVLDLGTGTGVLPLLLSAKTLGKEFHGLEIQDDMAEMAGRSVLLNELEGSVFIRQGDLRDVSTIYAGARFDVVVSNPPYIEAGTGLVNPKDTYAISRHEVMCTLEDVIKAASISLRDMGRFAMVHRPSRLVDIVVHMRNYGLEPKRMRFVHPKTGARPNMVLVEALKGGGRELEVQTPLYIYDDQGNYTGEVQKIYDHEMNVGGGN